MSGQHLRQFTAVAKRKKRTKKPKIPLSDKEVEEAWANILNQTHFVQGGELVQEVRKKVVMLGSDTSFELLSSNATHIFGDGTFRFAPNHYKQMFIVHIIKDNVYMCLLHISY